MHTSRRTPITLQPKEKPRTVHTRNTKLEQCKSSTQRHSPEPQLLSGAEALVVRLLERERALVVARLGIVLATERRGIEAEALRNLQSLKVENKTIIKCNENIIKS